MYYMVYRVVEVPYGLYPGLLTNVRLRLSSQRATLGSLPLTPSQYPKALCIYHPKKNNPLSDPIKSTPRSVRLDRYFLCAIDGSRHWA